MTKKSRDLDLAAIQLAGEAIDMVRLDSGESAGLVTALLAIEARLAWLGQIIQQR